jgi:flagellar hook protein FlgE
MMRSFGSAVSGLKTHQTMMDVVANDISNVNTVGFKANRFSFKDSFSQVLRNAGATGGGLGSTNAQQVGLGADTGSIDNMMSQGAISATGNPLDVAIQGEGFFRVTDDAAAFGSVQYTRAGNFALDENGKLITQDGFFVVGFGVTAGPPKVPNATQQTITVPTTARTLNIDQMGLVSYVDSAGVSADLGYISLAKFPNGAGLERNASNRWTQSLASGIPTAGTANIGGLGLLQNRSLEMSNVDLANEFSEMIKAQRGFQANSRTITTVDEMIQALVQMKR